MSVEQLIWDGTSRSRPDPTVYRRPDANDWREITSQLQRGQSAAYEQLMLLAGQFMVAGQPFYMAGDGVIYPADSTSFPEVMGLVVADGAGSIACVTSGHVTREGWGLTPGAVYFLSGSGLSVMPPTAGYIVEVGKAVAPETLDVKINPPVKL